MHIDRDELIQIFSAESDENLHEMELAFVQLESSPGDLETLQAIFRAAHTIKGNAASLAFPRSRSSRMAWRTSSIVSVPEARR
jgi:chemotaxis protein histidine kinase CheA